LEVKRKEATVGLLFLTRYALDSGFFFMLTSEHKRKIQQRVETYPLKNPPLGGGKAKGSTSLTRKIQQLVLGFSPQTWSFCRLVLLDDKRFWATIHRQLIYHKDFSSICARGMSNPVTHIT
jgi:hypothetical protein